MAPLLNGMLTGLFLQMALGPVFFYVLGITIDSDYVNSLRGVLGVTLADYIYIALSLAGIGAFLRKEKVKAVFGVAGSMVLTLFGLLLLHKGVAVMGEAGQAGPMGWTPLNSFTSCFALTISSPLTIVFWTGVFSAKAMEENYERGQLILFGAGTGASTFLFMASAMLILSILKGSIPALLVQASNCVVGLVLIYYGITRAIRAARVERGVTSDVS